MTRILMLGLAVLSFAFSVYAGHRPDDQVQAPVRPDVIQERGEDERQQAPVRPISAD